MEKRDTSNGIAWFDNIFQKFEGIYHDVDELVKQAESQLLTVGANVRNFFNELDLLGDAASQSSEDEKPGAAPDTSVVQKTGDAVCIKSLVSSDGGHGDEVHFGSVESVKSFSSSLSLEQIDDDMEKKRFQLQTPDKIDSSNADQEVGLDFGAKLLIPASDVGECKSFTQTENISTNLVNLSSTFSNDKKDLSNENQVGLDSGAKLLIPASEDIGEFNSFMETEERSKNLVNMSSKISDETRLSNPLEMDNLCEKSTTATLPTSATEPEGLELYHGSRCEESETTMHFPRSALLNEALNGSILEERDNDVTDSGLETLESLKKVELGESCILVDSSELECSYAEGLKLLRARLAYKKKLKDAFASRMGLLKKHNNAEQKKNSLSTLALSEKSNSPDYEFCESDWEIV